METNQAAIMIASYLMRAVCFAGAAFLAYHDKPGWGWLIFAGIVCAVSFSAGEVAEK